jgi:DNA helicase-2/ATP-dependent DNA helicase PcrA
MRINRADTYEAIRLILSDSGYGSYLAHRTADVSKTAALLAIADRHRTRKAFFDRLTELEELVKQGSPSRGGLLLSTIHSAKGMEFDHVLLCDCQNGILPSITEPQKGKTYTDKEKAVLEEERRLFYVGVTRAKKTLEIVTWERDFGEGAEGFRLVDDFLATPRKTTVSEGVARERKRVSKPKGKSTEELEKLMNGYYEGVPVCHKVFGDGVVIGRKGNFVQIQFARFSFPKKLDLALCIETDLIREL